MASEGATSAGLILGGFIFLMKQRCAAGFERESQRQVPNSPVSTEGNGLSGGTVWPELDERKGSSCHGRNVSAGSSEARRVSPDVKASRFCHAPACSILQVN